MVPSGKTPEIDAPRALQPDLMPHLPTECISAHVRPQEDIPFSGIPPRPALSNHGTITARKRGPKHVSSVTFTLV